MKDIVDWLLGVEQLAHEVYKTAAAHFLEDKEFSSFLSALADDESLHFQLIGGVAESLKKRELPPVCAIDLDPNSKKALEAPLRELHNLIQKGSITKDVALQSILEVEFSEFNYVFLYVMDTFQEDTRKCQEVAATIEAHRKRIEEFLKTLPGGLAIWKDFRKLPPVWSQKILVVEDDAALRKMFRQVLRESGAVETAANGREAMDKVKDHFFNVVVSDIDMPLMGGLEFYQKALEVDPDLGRRFLFCSGDINSEIKSFCWERNLVYLEKPFKLQEFRAAVQEIMEKSL